MRFLWILAASCALAQQPAPAVAPAVAPGLAPGAAQRAAIARQRESVRRQAESAGATLLPGATNETTPVAAEPACDALPGAEVSPLIEAAAKSQDLKPDLIRAVITQESAFRPCAVSGKGAQGLMQIMPATASQFGVTDPFDPRQNIDAGSKLLKQLLDKYKGDVRLALAAYNAGSGTVDAAGGIPAIAETQDYVKAITGKLDK